jgi:4-hydroxy-tetrahydrodipicolinate synthase
MMDVSGIWIPLVTPLAGGAVDHAALARLVAHLATQGVAGFVACGSTGEAAMLDAAEHEAVLATTLKAARGLPVMMGCRAIGPTAWPHARRPGRTPPVAAFLLPAPAYVKPSQAGIVDYFGTWPTRRRAPRRLRHSGAHRRAHRGGHAAGNWRRTPTSWP